MKKMRVLSLLLAAAVSVSLLAGCGGDTSTTSQGGTSGSTSGGSTTVSTEGREDLVICMPEDLETFDPISTSAMATQAVHNMMYIRLYHDSESGEAVPWLAEEFNVISDTEIDIKIKDGFTFTDGTPLTAEDVVYTLQRALESPNFSTLLATVEGFEVIDETSFRIITTGPSPSIQVALMHPGTGILPKAYVEQALANDDWSNPVCSGPFKLESRSVGESVKLVKNETFADEATSAQCNSLTFRYVPEASSRTILVETGEADVNFQFATADYARASENPDLAIHENTGTVVQYIGVDTTQAPFDNKLVRQAICYAINRDDVLTVVAEGLGTPAFSVLPPSTLGYVENPAGYTYDPEKAKALLAEAGYPDGFDTTLVAFNDLGKRVSEVVQMFLMEVGINAEIETYDTSVRQSMMANHQCPMFAAQWGAMTDADLVLPRLFTEEAIGGMNFSWFHSPELDELFAAGRATYDTAERESIYNEAVTILADEAPWCPLYIPSAFCLTNANLQGVELSGESIINMWNLHY